MSTHFNQVVSLRSRLDLRARAMKKYSAFPKAPALLEPHHQIVLCHIRTLVGRVSYPSAEMKSVFSTTPANGENCFVSLSFVIICLHASRIFLACFGTPSTMVAYLLTFGLVYLFQTLKAYQPL